MQARPDLRVLAWLYRHEVQLHLATLTLAEICKGIHLLAPGRKRRNLEEWFEELVLSFDGRILPFDLRAATTWVRSTPDTNSGAVSFPLSTASSAQ